MLASVSMAFNGKSANADLIFTTINLKEGEEPAQVLQNIRKAVERETGIQIGWAGVFVPATGNTRTTQPHIHVLLTNIEMYGPAWGAINRFMDGRNKIFPRSCHMTWAYGLDGLARYMEGEKNLRRLKATFVKTNEVGAEAERLCREGIEGLRAQIRQRLDELAGRLPIDHEAAASGTEPAS